MHKRKKICVPKTLSSEYDDEERMMPSNCLLICCDHVSFKDEDWYLSLSFLGLGIETGLLFALSKKALYGPSVGFFSSWKGEKLAVFGHRVFLGHSLSPHHLEEEAYKLTGENLLSF